MPSYVLKAERDRDLYVVWSTVVDAPTLWGSRDEVRAYLVEEFGRTGDADGRLARADEKGTSALWPSLHEPFAGWNDDGLILMEWDETRELIQNDLRVELPRANLAAFVDAVEAGRSVLPFVEVRDEDDNVVAAT